MTDFAEVWKSGPWQHKGRLQAQRKWAGIVKRGEVDAFLQATANYAYELQHQPWRTPVFGSTWFTSTWKDYVQEERTEAIADDGPHVIHVWACACATKCEDEECRLPKYRDEFCAACVRMLAESMR